MHPFQNLTLTKAAYSGHPNGKNLYMIILTHNNRKIHLKTKNSVIVDLKTNSN